MDVLCKTNHTSVCAVRKNNNTFEHRDFENSCTLLVNNICLYYENEFAIAHLGTCNDYIKARRNEEYTEGNEGVDNSGFPTEVTEPDGNDIETTTGNEDQETTDYQTDVTETDVNDDEIIKTTKPSLRKWSFSTLYEQEYAWDNHICPHSCTKVYKPICLSANRGSGPYFKMFVFINHCLGDLYYCQKPEDFAPPPGEDEYIKDSPISWSYCGANRFVSFARVSEDISSMSRYGWLMGDYRYSKILEPWERKPGYGR